MPQTQTLKKRLLSGYAVVIAAAVITVIFAVAFSGTIYVISVNSATTVENQITLVSETRKIFFQEQNSALLYFTTSNPYVQIKAEFEFTHTEKVMNGYIQQLYAHAETSMEKQYVTDFSAWTSVYGDYIESSFQSAQSGQAKGDLTESITDSENNISTYLTDYNNQVTVRLTQQQIATRNSFLLFGALALAFIFGIIITAYILSHKITVSILQKTGRLREIIVKTAPEVDKDINYAHENDGMAFKDELDAIIVFFEKASVRIQDLLLFQESILQNISADAFIVFDKKGRTLLCNDAFTQLLGWNRADIIGKAADFVFESRESYLEMNRNIMDHTKNGERYICESYVLRKSGERVHVEMTFSFVPKLKLFILVGKDLTQRDEMEGQLLHLLDMSETSRSMLETTLNTVHDAIILFDNTGQILTENKTNLERKNTFGDVYGNNPEIRAVDDDGMVIPPSEYPVRKFLQQKQNSTALMRFRKDNEQSMIIRMYLAEICDARENQIGVLSVESDITEEYRNIRRLAATLAVTKACSSASDISSVANAAAHALLQCEKLQGVVIAVPEKSSEDGNVYLKILSCVTPELFDQDFKNWLDESLRLLSLEPISANSHFMFHKVFLQKKPQYDYTPFSQTQDDGIIPRDLIQLGYFLNLNLSATPLISNSKMEGILGLFYYKDTDVRENLLEGDVLLTISSEIASALNRAKLYEEDRKLALYDPLTNVYNHRSMQMLLKDAVQQSAIAALDLSVIMLDVDHFRKFNEDYGHDIGDLALKSVAESIRIAIRKNDYAARYGGEEFTVILPNTSTDEAFLIADRIRKSIQDRPIVVQDGRKLSITASLGFATFPMHASAPVSLLKAADIALYAAKKNGRNCVMQYSTHYLSSNTFKSENNGAEITSFEGMSLPSGANLDTVQALITAIDLRDGFTASHSESVSALAVSIGEELQLSSEEIETLRLGGLVHDIGKIGVPDSVLAKNGPLTDEEWVIMRAHTTMGDSIIRSVEQLKHLLPIVRWHHERLDGSGYPDGLAGDSIPQLVRIISVADIYDAFVAERRYHKSRKPHDGIAILEEEAQLGKVELRYVEVLKHVLAIRGDLCEESENIQAA